MRTRHGNDAKSIKFSSDVVDRYWVRPAWRVMAIASISMQSIMYRYG